MVATSSPLAAQAALWALGEGGTAVDAAIASDAVLGLAQPMSTGVGGDAFCLVDDGRVRAGWPYATAPPAGGRFANPALAETLAAVAGGGAEAHYGGRWGKEAVEAVAADGGVLTQDDLIAHAGEWVTPITGAYRGHEVV